MMRVNLSEVNAILHEVAQDKILSRHGKLGAHEIWDKNQGVFTHGAVRPDYVTIADREAEQALSARLQDYLPDSLVVGEEAYAADHSVVAHFDTDKPVWIIDPVDGTRNFVEGKPEFAVMCALVQKRKAIAAWIHHPLSGDTIMAEKGGGVWLRSVKLKLAADNVSSASLGLAGSRIKKYIGSTSPLPRSPDMPRIEIGSCAGFDYPRLFVGAGGESITFADAVTSRVGFLIYHRTKPWDHVPGMLMHSEAGGYSADWLGRPYHFNETKAGLIYAPSLEGWNFLQGLFRPMIEQAMRKSA